MSKEGIVSTIGELPEESLVAQAGVQSGDEIVAIDGRRVDFFGQHDLHVFNQVLRGRDIELQVRQNNDIKTINLDVSGLPIYNMGSSFLNRALGFVPVSPELTTTFSLIVDDSPASRAGLQAGDQLVEIDGVTVSSWSQMVEIISTSPEQTLSIKYYRDKVLQQVEITPALYEEGEQRIGRIGVAPTALPYAENQIITMQRSPWQALKYGVEQTWLMSSVTVRMLWKMLTLQVSHKNISGPITIAQVTGQAIQISLDYYLHILAVISISLGVMNLLPIPILDGGHLLVHLVEGVAGKRAAENFFAVGQRIGLFVLIGFMGLAFYNDIFRLLN